MVFPKDKKYKHKQSSHDGSAATGSANGHGGNKRAIKEAQTLGFIQGVFTSMVVIVGLMVWTKKK
jgi:hypothetical protein